MDALIDVVLHLDKHLLELTSTYGTWIYAILFLIIFCETGLVVTPFLPGDSLLFAAGAIAAVGSLNVWYLAVLLTVAAVLGDTVNYHFGKFLGPQVLRNDTARWLNRKHLVRTQSYFERYGARTIILARFVPIVRTFAPFVAGVGMMQYRRFLTYNVVGGVIWIVVFLFAGYWFGNVPLVQRNFPLVIVAVIFVSVLPLAFDVVRAWSTR